MEIQVAAYHVRVKQRHTSKFEMLSAIGGSIDFLSFLQDSFKKWRSSHDNDEEENRVAKVERFQVLDRVIQGRIQVGDYGQACDVIDAKEPAKVVFNKSVQHADLLPFFFRIDVPEHRDEALLLIEKSRKSSPKTAFTRYLRNAFKAQFPDSTMTIDTVMPQEVFRQYLDEGGVHKIEFIHMGIPHDITDILDGGHQEELKRVTTKLVITAGRKQILPLKKSLLKSSNPRKAISDLYEPKDFESQNVAVTVRLGKNSRKVDLGSKHVAPLYDVTSEVKRGRDGIGTYESMAAAFERLAEDIKEGAYANT